MPLSRIAKLTTATTVCVLAACSGGEDVGSTESDIYNGTADTTHTYAVGIIREVNNQTFVCSGTLIAPNVVQTARHCVQELTTPEGAGVSCKNDTFKPVDPSASFIVTTESSTRKSLSWHGVSMVYRPRETGACGNDIAWLILDQNIASTEATPVVPMLDYSAAHYDKFTAIGYGRISPDDNSSNGYRRIRQNISIDCVPGSSVECDAAVLAGSISSNEFISDKGVCSGDSGSGAYEQNSFDDGTPMTLGVGVRANNCDGVVYTRLDVWKKSVIAIANRAAQLGGYPLPEWAGGDGVHLTDGGLPYDAGSARDAAADAKQGEPDASEAIDGGAKDAAVGNSDSATADDAGSEPTADAGPAHDAGKDSGATHQPDAASADDLDGVATVNDPDSESTDDGRVHAFIPASSPHSSSGCAVSAVPTKTGSYGALVGIVAAVALMERRRRKRA